MVGDTLTPSFRRLLELHGGLESLARSADGQRFVSGWHAANPFAQQFLGPLAAPGLDSTSYQSFTSDDVLLGRIQALHRRFDGVELSRGRILPGDGSTGLITTFFFWL